MTVSSFIQLGFFREFSYQNKWLVSLNHLPQPIVDDICTTDDQYPSDYTAFSADGYTLQIIVRFFDSENRAVYR